MKSNTQNAKIEAITEKTLVLGIDVGSETHYARAFDYRGIEYSKKPFKFSNTEVGFATFKEWILDLKERHEKDKVVPGMEPTGHYWFNLGKFLQDNEMKPVLVTASTLTEFGFITNKAEAASMKANTNKYGKAMFNSVVKMFQTNPSKR